MNPPPAQRFRFYSSAVEIRYLDRGSLSLAQTLFLRRQLNFYMGPGPGLVARVLWQYCIRLASSGGG